MTLWSRIDSALETSLAKAPDGDTERLVTLCLEHVKADGAKAAACEALYQFVSTAATRDADWHLQFFHHLRSHRYTVIAHGRTRWQRVLAKEVEL